MDCASRPEPTLRRELMQAVQAGLPLTLHPWRALADQLSVSETEVLDELQNMLDDGSIRRIGVVPNHYALGYRFNLMVVWDVEDSAVDSAGEELGKLDYISHCYRRPRQAGWHYNLFTMVHGKSEQEVDEQTAAIQKVLADNCHDHCALKSTRILKKTGIRLKTEG